jgi:TrmH family RNA methyltransferase
VDVYSPKVVRAGMGAHFQLPLLQLETQDLAQVLETHNLTLLLAEAGAEQNYSQLDLTQPVALVVGGEAEGPSRALHQLPHTAVRIPMPGRAESLNAGVAGSILMAEVARQRAEPEQPQ